MGLIPRLVFLAEEHRVSMPRDIAGLIPYGEFLQKIAEKGLIAAAIDFEIDQATALKFYDTGQIPPGGSKPKRGDVEEFRYTVGQCALDKLEMKRSELSLDEYLNLVAAIRDYVIFGGDELVITDEILLGGDNEVDKIPKFDSGFTPLDELTGGFYQGIVTIMGYPGHGKTSVMLAMLESMRKTGVITSSIFYEVEIARDMMLWKLKPVKERTQLLDEDKLLTGNWTTRQILKQIVEDPDPNRVIFIDGPDAMTASVGDKKRFALEAIYRDLRRMAGSTKLVVVSSQPRRGDPEIQLDSGAEAWAKAWYSDIIIGIHKQGPRGGGVYRVMANIPKNRFGQSGNHLSFDFNYLDLSWNFTKANNEWDFDWMSGKNGNKKVARTLTNDRKTKHVSW